jgi:hypothetical protein
VRFSRSVRHAALLSHLFDLRIQQVDLHRVYDSTIIPTSSYPLLPRRLHFQQYLHAMAGVSLVQPSKDGIDTGLPVFYGFFGDFHTV